MKRKEIVGMLLTLLLVSLLFVFSNILSVMATTTIYIRADGSVDPSTAKILSLDNVTYEFTDNISNSIVVQRNNVTINGEGFVLQGAGSGIGIDLTNRTNVTIRNVKVRAFDTGIYLAINSSENNILGNDIANNSIGINVYYLSYYNKILGNNITGSSNSIYGIRFFNSPSYNLVAANNISNAGWGIYLQSCDSNNVSRNDIMSNKIGLYMDSSNGNRVYNNNFVNNQRQHYSESSANVWDDGYPTGGNYWSDYNGTDNFKGPYQNETGSDGIGDTPYPTLDNVNDTYPLMNPIIHVHDVACVSLSHSKMSTGGCSVVCRSDAQGHVNITLSISVLIANHGDFTETCNVTTELNSTEINYTQVILTTEQYSTISLTWIVPSDFVKGNYSLTASVEPVPGETNTADNNFTVGWIYVSMTGDLTGTPGHSIWDFVPDKTVDGSDLIVVAHCFGSYPGAPPPMVWNANCDITNDGSIDGSDLIIVARHFGQSDP
jgi:parallel beta-helix repeat protein